MHHVMHFRRLPDGKCIFDAIVAFSVMQSRREGCRIVPCSGTSSSSRPPPRTGSSDGLDQLGTGRVEGTSTPPLNYGQALLLQPAHQSKSTGPGVARKPSDLCGVQ